MGTGGGGSFTPDGTYPQYTSMTALSAGIPDVGMVAELVGATTGARILTAFRVAEGANGLITVNEWDLRQADGTEFDGAWEPAQAGATDPTRSWATAGASGGLNLTGGGYLMFPGWLTMRRLLASVTAKLVWTSLPGGPVNFDGAAVGIVGVESGRFSGGGTLYTSGTAYRTTAVTGVAVSGDPASGTTGNTFAPTAAQSWMTGYWRSSYDPTGGNASAEAITARLSPTYLGTSPARPSPGAMTGSGDATQAPALYVRAAQARITHLNPIWGAEAT